MKKRALIIGAFGGVGSAVLALLKNTESGRDLSSRFERIFLLDKAVTVPLFAVQEPFSVLPPASIKSAEQLTDLIREIGVNQVIDLSSIDTIECTEVCEQEGADFLCTSVEEWPGRESIPTDRAIRRLLSPEAPPRPRRSHLVGSGANPGIVNALVFAGLEAFGRKVGVRGTPRDLDLASILITEEDTTSEMGAPQSDGTFAMTWSPSHCLEELYEPSAFFVSRGKAQPMGHRPTDFLYRATCGEREIEGMLVPHEETKTLGRAFPSVEIGFIYRIPAQARKVLSGIPGAREAAALKTRVLRPPFTRALQGHDRLGILLSSRTFGELWIGYSTDVANGLRFGTNATQLQVATGVLAGWTQLGKRTGIHFVEDLSWRGYLEVVNSVLGSPLRFYNPSARALSLKERRVSREREKAVIPRKAVAYI